MNIFKDYAEQDSKLGNTIEPVTAFDPSPGFSSLPARADHRHKLDSSAVDALVGAGQNMADNPIFYHSQRPLPTSSINTFVFDRWYLGIAGTGVITTGQDTDVPSAELLTSASLVTTTADASMAAGDAYFFQQGVEGFILNKLGYGTAAAKFSTVSFWAKSTLAGTYCVAIRNYAGNRSFVKEYYLSANTWTKVVIVVPPDTGGTWVRTNAGAATLAFTLASGTTYHTTNTESWQAGNLIATSNQVNFAGTLSNEFNITGVKWEVGPLASVFVIPDLVEDLDRCRRYLQIYVDPPLRGMVTGGGAANRLGMTFIAPMRAAPVLTFFGTAFAYDGVTPQQLSAITASYYTNQSAEHDCTFTGAAWVAGRAAGLYYIGNSTWTYSAEI
jgi:hypothetical protein